MCVRACVRACARVYSYLERVYLQGYAFAKSSTNYPIGFMRNVLCFIWLLRSCLERVYLQGYAFAKISANYPKDLCGKFSFLFGYCVS